MAKAKRKRKHTTTRRRTSHRAHSVPAPRRRRRRKGGLSAGSMMTQGFEMAKAAAGGAVFTAGVHSFPNLPKWALILLGGGGAIGVGMFDRSAGAGWAGAFGSMLTSYFFARQTLAKTGTSLKDDYAPNDVFKALPIKDSEGHPLVIDESTGKAYCHEANGKYRELTPAEYESVKHDVAEHYGINPAMADSPYALRDNAYALRDSPYALR